MPELTASPDLLIPQLIVGLGNPEPKYERTRHNIGFAAIDALSHAWGISLSDDRKFQGSYGEGLVMGNLKIRLLKPLTYMNRSGQAIRATIDWFKLSPQSVLVIYDEMDLPLGKIRLRLSGSAGGHNGMKSVISHLGTPSIPRLRIGIGKPTISATADKDHPSISYVLGRFCESEARQMEEVLQRVVAAVESSLKVGVEQAMNLYNNQTPSSFSPS
jgi:PTH1 family peptidyl-tRNA hydrolase